MKFFRSLGLAIALALAAITPGIAANADVTYPFTNPTYIPTAAGSEINLTAAGTYVFQSNGLAAATVRITGSRAALSATIQGTNDGTNWTTLQAIPVGGGPAVTTITANGFWTVNVAGFTQARVNVATLTTGNARIQMAGTTGPGSVYVLNTPAPATAGGAAVSKVISTASTNATAVKASPGQVYGVYAVNTNAATAFLKLYNVAVAPTCNESPVIATLPLVQNIPVSVSIPAGIEFAAGIGLCITGAAADNDNTNATTGITANVAYK